MADEWRFTYTDLSEASDPCGMRCLFLLDVPATRSDTSLERGLIFSPGLRLGGPPPVLGAGDGDEVDVSLSLLERKIGRAHV